MIGNKIKNLRQNSNLTLQDLGEKLGVKHAYLSNLENERQNPSDDKVEQILTLGFGFEKQEAKKTVDKWRIEERLSRGNITIHDLNIAGDSKIQNITGENPVISLPEKTPKALPEEVLKQMIELKKAGMTTEEIKDFLNL